MRRELVKEQWIPFSELMPGMAEAWVEYCIQEACRRRGWDWYIEEYADPGERLPCMAFIESNPAWEADGHSPADALLAAYISALKSQ